MQSLRTAKAVAHLLSMKCDEVDDKNLEISYSTLQKVQSPSRKQLMEVLVCNVLS